MNSPAEPFPGAGYVIPTHDESGQPLSAEAQFQELKRVPQFVEKALKPHTPESRMFADLKQRMAVEAENPSLPTMTPARATDFRIPYPVDLDRETAGFQTADRQIRGWLVAAGLDQTTGNSLVELM